MTAANFALGYIGRGWSPIPIPFREKRCVEDNWPALRVSEADVPRYFANNPQNVGVLLGSPSQWLVDVDLDCPEAVALADLVLPPTQAVFGRKSHPRSHRLYYAEGATNLSLKFGADGSLVELHSTGRQSVFPGSTHKDTGETIMWSAEGAPSRVDAAVLTRQVQRLGGITLLALHWPALGARDEAALALAGMMLEAGRPEDETEKLIEVIATLGGSTDVQAKVRKVEPTARRLHGGAPIAGRSRLAELMGKDVVDTAVRWMGLVSKSRPATNETCTDAGNGERFIAEHGDHVRFVYPWKSWLVWDGRRWSIDRDGSTERYAMETARGILGEASEVVGQREQQDLVKWALVSQNKPKLEAMLWAARSHRVASVDELDADPFLLNVPNGTIDLRTGKLRPHNRLDYMTKLGGPPFDPGAECRGWLQFLSDITGGDTLVMRYLQLAVGYTLTGDVGEQCLFIMFGEGSNGKSCFIEVIRGLFGDYSRPTEFKTLIHKPFGDGVRNDIAGLRGARLVTSVETNRGQRFDEALLKQLTGGDKITARFLYQEFFDFHPTFKLWLAVNHKPAIHGVDHGMWRRIRLIPFEVKIPTERQVKNLGAKLLATEGSGILRWAIDGCAQWLKGGLPTPSIVTQATEDYKHESDILRDFIDMCCVTARNTDRGTELHVEAGQLYKTYLAWCEDSGEQPMKQRSFGVGLRERGYKAANKYIAGTTRRTYVGLALLAGGSSLEAEPPF
jgi:putative DNA primase/helicase